MRSKSGFSWLFTLCSVATIFLAACQQEINEPKASGAPQVTVQTTPTPTVSPTPNNQASHQEPIAASPTTTSTPTKTPRPSKTPTPVTRFTKGTVLQIDILSKAPAPKENTSYHLQTPNPEQLIAILTSNRFRYINNLYGFSLSFENTVERQDVIAFQALIEADLTGYFPEDIPNPAQYVRSYIPEWEGQYMVTSDIILDLLISGAYEFFNEEQIQFEDQQKRSFPVFSTTAYSMLGEGDQTSVWLIETDFSDHYELMTWLPLAVNSDGSYTNLPSDLRKQFITMSNDAIIKLDVGHDLNGDGYRDIVIGTWSYMAGSMSGFVGIYAFTGREITYLDSIRLPSVVPLYGESYISEFEVLDTNGDGVSELHITWPRFRSFDCAWVTKYQHSWAGQYKTVITENEEIPDIPACYIAKALDSESPAMQAKLFEAALDHIEGEDNPDLRTWLQWRRTIAYALDHQDDQAKALLDALLESVGEGRLLELIQEAAEEWGHSPRDICRSLYALTLERRDAGGKLRTGIDQDLAYFGFYPISFEPNPFTVCPYPDLVRSQFEHLTIPDVANPGEALLDRGYRLVSAQNVIFQMESEAARVGVIQDGQYAYLGILVEQPSGWRIDQFVWPDNQPMDIEVVYYDTQQDGDPEILVLTTHEVNTNLSCNPEDYTYVLYLFTNTAEGYELAQKRTIPCHPEKPVDLLLRQGRENFVDYIHQCEWCNLDEETEDVTALTTEPSAWAYLLGFEKLPDHIGKFERLETLQANVLAKKNLATTRNEIQVVMDGLPRDDPYARMVWTHLYFLLGLSFEIDQQPDQAAEVFVDLIRESPESPWSWLAWTRISPNPISQ